MYFFTNNVTTLAAREAQNQKKSSLFGFVFDLHYLCSAKAKKAGSVAQLD